MIIDDEKGFANIYSIDLDNEGAIERLAIYSSSVGRYILNNTLLIDESNNIMGFKYNGVDGLVKDKNCFMSTVKNGETKNYNGFFIIGLDKKAHYIDFNIKYNYIHQREYFKYFMEYIRSGNINTLIDNLKNLC